MKNTINTIIIKDQDSGKAYMVHTLRTAAEIAGLIDETEKEIIEEKKMEAANVG